MAFYTFFFIHECNDPLFWKQKEIQHGTSCSAVVIIVKGTMLKGFY
jgi:hypothetical protein